VDYIYINSINDIQPEKISIRQLNKKYIDKMGNRYATKFNLKTKKVEIVRLATSKEEALRLREEIRREKLIEKPGRGGILSGSKLDQNMPDYFKSDDSFETPSSFFETNASSRELQSPQDSGISSEDFDPYLMDVDRGGLGSFEKRNLTGVVFYEKPFIDKCISEIQKTKERQNAFINYIKKTKLFDREEKERFDELEREIDIECWQRGEKAVNYHRELYSYPRPINYYLARVPSDKKKVLESKKEEEKLDLVRRWELQEVFEKTFSLFFRTTEKAYFLLQEKISHDAFSNLPAQTQQLLKDSRTSCEIVMQASKEILQEIKIWRNKFP